MLPCLLFNSGLTVKSLFVSLFFYWMASQSSLSITSLMDFIECCTFLYLHYTTCTYPMCWGLSFLYINKFLLTYQNKIYVYHAFWTASGWSDDDAYCWPWNNSCCSYLGCFPACTSMILHYQLLIQHCKFHENGFLIHALPWLTFINGSFLLVKMMRPCSCILIFWIAEPLQNEKGSSRDWFSAWPGETNLWIG